LLKNIFCTVSFIVLKLKFLDNTIVIIPEIMVMRLVRLLCEPRMSNFETITAEVTIFEHRAL